MSCAHRDCWPQISVLSPKHRVEHHFIQGVGLVIFPSLRVQQAHWLGRRGNSTQGQGINTPLLYFLPSKRSFQFSSSPFLPESHQTSDHSRLWFRLFVSVSQDQTSFQKEDRTVSVLSGKRGLYHSKGHLSYLRGTALQWEGHNPHIHGPWAAVGSRHSRLLGG